MSYWLDILNMVLIFSIFTISLNLLMGYTGQVSVAHAAFGAIGGYLAAYLAGHAGAGFWTGIAVGTLGAGVAGLAVSLPALRLSGEYLILLTVAVSSIVLTIVGATPELGGNYGIVADRAANLSPLPGGDLLTPGQWVVPLLGFAALTFFVCHRLGESAWGRVLRGIREDEKAMQALGRDVFAFKAFVFVLTAAFAGLAGVLLFYYNQLCSPRVYGFNVSLAIFAMVIFGGLGNFLGSVVGTLVLQLLQPLLEQLVSLDPNHAFLMQLVIYGFGIVAMAMVRPQGLIPEGVSWSKLWHRPRIEPPVPASADADLSPELEGVQVQMRSARVESAASPKSPVVSVTGLEKQFGGIVACRDLSFELSPGRIAALIGPNGAGKTTVFNLLTGALTPDEGQIRLHGEDVVGLGTDAIARRGMVRSFQDVRLFRRLSALENVMLAIRHATNSRWRWPSGTKGGENLADLFLFTSVAAEVERDTQERAMHWLRQVGLVHVANVQAGELAFGDQKLISLARLLATDADVLLLDEPTSGIDGRWVDRTLEVVSSMRARGKTVCIVEHSLHVVEQLADTVLFMELGRVSASGTIHQLTSDRRLAEVYFGTI